MQEVQKVRFREEIILEQNSFSVYQFSFFFNSLYTMRYYLHTRLLPLRYNTYIIVPTLSKSV